MEAPRQAKDVAFKRMCDVQQTLATLHGSQPSHRAQQIVQRKKLKDAMQQTEERLVGIATCELDTTRSGDSRDNEDDEAWRQESKL